MFVYLDKKLTELMPLLPKGWLGRVGFHAARSLPHEGIAAQLPQEPIQ